MIKRNLEPILRTRLAAMAGVVLLGPRQIGKTTLARQLAENWPGGAVYLDLERPGDRRRLDDADTYLRAQRGKLVVIDEIHRAPGLFAILRGIIDDWRAAGNRYGHFLLVGSAAIELMRQASETLAGWVAYLDMATLDVAEFTAAGIDLDRLWVRGGFPDSLLAASDMDSLDWRRDFIRSYLERDVPMFAPRLPAETVGRLWLNLAHQQGGRLNLARLAASLGVSAPAIGRYVDLLADLRLLRRLPPWSGNLDKRLVKAPKIYIRDSGIVHAQLELNNSEHIVGHPVAGLSYDGMVVENLIQAAGERRQAYYFRTQDGAEIDLVFESGGTPELAVEIRRSSAPALDKGFSTACDALGITARYVVYAGDQGYPLRRGAQAIPLGEMVGRLRG